MSDTGEGNSSATIDQRWFEEALRAQGFLVEPPETEDAAGSGLADAAADNVVPAPVRPSEPVSPVPQAGGEPWAVPVAETTADQASYAFVEPPATEGPRVIAPSEPSAPSEPLAVAAADVPTVDVTAGPAVARPVAGPKREVASTSAALPQVTEPPARLSSTDIAAEPPAPTTRVPVAPTTLAPGQAPVPSASLAALLARRSRPTTPVPIEATRIADEVEPPRQADEPVPAEVAPPHADERSESQPTLAPDVVAGPIASAVATPEPLPIVVPAPPVAEQAAAAPGVTNDVEAPPTHGAVASGVPGTHETGPVFEAVAPPDESRTVDDATTHTPPRERPDVSTLPGQTVVPGSPPDASRPEGSSFVAAALAASSAGTSASDDPWALPALQAELAAERSGEVPTSSSTAVAGPGSATAEPAVSVADAPSTTPVAGTAGTPVASIIPPPSMPPVAPAVPARDVSPVPPPPPVSPVGSAGPPVSVQPAAGIVGTSVDDGESELWGLVGDKTRPTAEVAPAASGSRWTSLILTLFVALVVVVLALGFIYLLTGLV